MTAKPQGGLRVQAKRRREQRIRAAAAALLREKAFDQITTREVAARADIGEATLFRYIGNKHELLTLVYGDQLDEVLTRIELEDARAAESGTSAADSIDRILAVYHHRCDFYLTNPANAARYLREGFTPGGPQQARHLAQGDRTIRLIASIIREAQDRGTMAPGIDPALVAQNLHGTYMHEIDRTPARGFAPEAIWDRLEPRLRVQVEPLARTLTP